MKMIKHIFRTAMLAGAISCLGHAFSVSGATATVLVGSGGLKFVPAVTNITVNDRVIWNWAGSPHSTTSGTAGTPDGLWDSSVQNAPHSFTNIFNTVGTFPYYCILHASLGMTGTIIVAAASPPTANVLVGSGGLVFSPAVTNIPVHGRVIWTWTSTFHSTTSGTSAGGTGTPDGLWDSSVYTGALPHSFTNTFDTAGAFPYYCSLHVSSGMVGTINVIGPNVPPTVTFTNPANGITLSAPASLTLVADAADADGSVTNVQFFQGATSLDNITAAPFSRAVNNLAAADYVFSAIASDNSGATATNSITIHVINPHPVAISAPIIAPPGGFQFSYSADIGLTYVVQISTNLLDWVSLMTNTATASPVTFSDLNTGGSGVFYRVGRLPNP